jgi:2-methylcitrate dehydratase PrpD
MARGAPTPRGRVSLVLSIVIVHDGCEPFSGAFTEEVVRDPAVAALRRRITVREDPDLNAHVPRLKPARVTVTFSDGRQVTRLRESARGDYRDPYGEGEVRSKFRELAGLVLSPAGVARVEATLDRLDDLPRLGDLVEALRDDRAA